MTKRAASRRRSLDWNGVRRLLRFTSRQNETILNRITVAECSSSYLEVMLIDLPDDSRALTDDHEQKEDGNVYRTSTLTTGGYDCAVCDEEGETGTEIIFSVNANERMDGGKSSENKSLHPQSNQIPLRNSPTWVSNNLNNDSASTRPVKEKSIQKLEEEEEERNAIPKSIEYHEKDFHLTSSLPSKQTVTTERLLDGPVNSEMVVNLCSSATAEVTTNPDNKFTQKKQQHNNIIPQLNYPPYRAFDTGFAKFAIQAFPVCGATPNDNFSIPGSHSHNDSLSEDKPCDSYVDDDNASVSSSSTSSSSSSSSVPRSLLSSPRTIVISREMSSRTISVLDNPRHYAREISTCVNDNSSVMSESLTLSMSATRSSSSGISTIDSLEVNDY